jgi:hypothetical protein
MTNSGRSGRSNARSDDWQRLRTLEDILALLQDVDEQRAAIKRAAWVAGHGEIYQASKKQAERLERLKARLSARWHELFEDLDSDTATPGVQAGVED